jgi:hypothetical protein
MTAMGRKQSLGHSTSQSPEPNTADTLEFELTFPDYMKIAGVPNGVMQSS